MATLAKPSNGKHLQRIVLTPDVLSPPMPEFSVDYEHVAAPLYHDLFLERAPRQEMKVDVSAWTVSFEYEYDDTYKKLASVIGHDQAEAAVEALNEPVPKLWNDMAESVDAWNDF